MTRCSRTRRRWKPSQHQLDQADKRFEVGLIAITDVQEAKSARDTAAAAVIAAKRTLATDIYRLEEITGQKYDQLSKPDPRHAARGPEPAGRGALGRDLARPEPDAGREPPGGRRGARQRARRLRRTPADPRPGRRPHLQQDPTPIRPRGREVQQRRQQVQRPQYRPAVHAADLQRRVHAVQGARERVPLAGRQGGGGAELARHRTRRARRRISA